MQNSCTVRNRLNVSAEVMGEFLRGLLARHDDHAAFLFHGICRGCVTRRGARLFLEFRRKVKATPLFASGGAEGKYSPSPPLAFGQAWTPNYFMQAGLVR